MLLYVYTYTYTCYLLFIFNRKQFYVSVSPRSRIRHNFFISDVSTRINEAINSIVSKRRDATHRYVFV